MVDQYQAVRFLFDRVAVRVLIDEKHLAFFDALNIRVCMQGNTRIVEQVMQVHFSKGVVGVLI